MTKFFMTLVLINCVFASTKFDGFYIGKQIGVNAVVANKESVLNFNSVKGSNPEPFRSEGALGAHGLLIGIFGGYGQTYRNAYLGIEIYYNVSKNDILLIKSVGENSKISSNGNCGLKLRMGYIVSADTMLYCSMGNELNEWKFKSDKAENTTVKTPKVIFTYSLGMETHLTDDLFLRSEYMHVPAPSMQLTFKNKNISTSNSDVEACQHRITIGVGYRF
jgi:opacity protein-like surface antigen